MIEKIIHYVWLGKGKKPASVVKNIKTWKKCNPDFELKEWNENNFDVTCNSFVEQAYKEKNMPLFQTIFDYMHFIKMVVFIWIQTW
ncbi:TcdA/TcdB catalytic glycosyltransferase domain protein [Fructobacillus sp. EFB-N1]|uniref:hypothetical protein n=1 Tax=Fructobacillus sp. EFB-N1 TaxID=1658766 RepID=UPI00065D92D2|nr:hypothetical protein [Fructobacillus sp. EFB-N1]KMK52676.1 TcdA/TcdB catalytic glycosyltransferase domain protein [Fructobacillus sp. EFB-N1]